MTLYRFKKDYAISKAQIDRLRNNQGVTLNTIDKLCNTLDCDLTDIMEHVKDDNVFEKRKPER